MHVGTSDLRNDINLLSNVKKIVSKTIITSPNSSMSFSNIFEQIRETEKHALMIQKNG